MFMLYNSDAYAVVRFDLEPSQDAQGEPQAPAEPRGFEIVDKLSRKEIFLSGLVAMSFQRGAQALSEKDPTPEQWDEYIAGFTSFAQQPLVIH